MRDNTKLQYLKYALVSSLLLIATFTLAPARADQRADFLAGRTRDCRRCDLAGLNFKRRDLSGADLTGANLRDTNFHDAKLVGARLAGADLTAANLNKANLSRTEMGGAILRRANLHEIKLDGAVFRATAMPDGSTRDE